MLPLLVLLATIAGAWYLLIVRPQQHQQTRHGRLVDQLQVGSHVLTVGGIFGRVVAIAGSSVELELAPGVLTRIATDGIARIAHAGEAAVATNSQTAVQAAAQAPNERMDIPMEDQQQAQHPSFSAPAWTAPQQPYVASMPATQVAPGQTPSPSIARPTVAPPATTTLRAHVVGSSIPTFEPRPWRDVAPINQRPAAPAPVITPFQQPQAVQHQHHMVQHQVVPPQPGAVPVEQVIQERRHSKAPAGMGSTLRLDDPSIRDTMVRARGEREGLANEYRKLTAPLVDTGPSVAPVQDVAHHALHHAEPKQLVGHDPNGAPLFASPAAPVAQGAAQYPAPARPASDVSIPRPVVQAPAGTPDPALTSNAFQRRTPYSPDPALASNAS